MKALSNCMGSNHPLRAYMDRIEAKVPSELLDQVRNVHVPDSPPHADVPSEKALIRLHKNVSVLKPLWLSCKHRYNTYRRWG